MSVTDALLAFYAAGVIIATVGGSVAGQKLGSHDQPASRVLLWSVIAGVLWPVLLVGIAEIGVWMLTKAVARTRSARRVGGEGWPRARPWRQSKRASWPPELFHAADVVNAPVLREDEMTRRAVTTVCMPQRAHGAASARSRRTRSGR